MNNPDVNTQPCSVCGSTGEVWGLDEQGNDMLQTCYLCLGRGVVEVTYGKA